MTKKVEVTKAELVRQVEQKFRLPKFALNSLERANKETIKVILSQQSTDVNNPAIAGFFIACPIDKAKNLCYTIRVERAGSFHSRLPTWQARAAFHLCTQFQHLGLALRRCARLPTKMAPVRTGPAPLEPHPLIFWGRFEIRLSLLAL